MSDLTISQIQQDIRDSLVVDPMDDRDTSIALGGEIGELFNYLKKERRTVKMGGLPNSLQKEIEMEIPDIIYYTIALAMARDIDIQRVWETKLNHNELKYNRTVKPRPYNCLCEKCMAKREELGITTFYHGDIKYIKN